MLQVLTLHCLAAIADLDLETLRPRAGDGGHLVHRELALGQDREHLAAHVPRRSYHSHPITHLNNPRSKSVKMKKAPWLVCQDAFHETSRFGGGPQPSWLTVCLRSAIRARLPVRPRR